MCICLLLKQTIASMPVLLTPGLARCEERKKSKVIIVVVICILQFFNRVNVGRLVCRNTIVTYQGEICWLAWPDYYLCSFFFNLFHSSLSATSSLGMTKICPRTSKQVVLCFMTSIIDQKVSPHKLLFYQIQTQA